MSRWHFESHPSASTHTLMTRSWRRNVCTPIVSPLSLILFHQEPLLSKLQVRQSFVHHLCKPFSSPFGNRWQTNKHVFRMNARQSAETQHPKSKRRGKEATASVIPANNHAFRQKCYGLKWHLAVHHPIVCATNCWHMASVAKTIRARMLPLLHLISYSSSESVIVSQSRTATPKRLCAHGKRKKRRTDFIVQACFECASIRILLPSREQVGSINLPAGDPDTRCSGRVDPSIFVYR